MRPDGEPPRPFARRRPGAAVRLLQAVRRWRTPVLSRYAPTSTLELPVHAPTRAAVPAVDFHTHIGRWLSPSGGWMEPDVGRLLDAMDESNVAGLVNLDGRWGRELEENLDRYDRAHPGRFYTFCHADWRLLDERLGPERLAATFERSVRAGARGLKVWKDLGLGVQVRGRRILPDDPVLAPLWDSVAASGVPVLIHVADPVAFFLPVDRRNERIEELRRNPRGARHPGGIAEFRRLIDSLESLVATQPRISFVVAHGYFPENLAHVAAVMDRYPNLSVDIGAVAATLGRQPRAARALMLDHADRVLFGTDVFPWRSSARNVYYRLLETDDEAFTYSDEPAPPCGRWQVYGLDLPRPVLERVYRQNAAVLLGLDAPAPDLLHEAEPQGASVRQWGNELSGPSATGPTERGRRSRDPRGERARAVSGPER